jgi:hypothetical protein
MSGVEFDDNNTPGIVTRTGSSQAPIDDSPMIIKALKKTKVVTSTHQANVVLLILAILFLITAVLVYFKATRGYILRPEIKPLVRPPANIHDNPPYIKK